MSRHLEENATHRILEAIAAEASCKWVGLHGREHHVPRDASLETRLHCEITDYTVLIL